MRRCFFIFVFGLTACSAHQAGQGAAKGALNEVREESHPTPQGPPPIQEAVKSGVNGAIQSVDDPQNRQRIEQIIREATADSLAAAAGEPAKGAGAWGGGPAPYGAAPISLMGGRFSEGFTMGLSKQLQSELGANGDGPLGKSLTGLVEQVSSAAVNGAAREISPLGDDCAGSNRRECLDSRVREVSRSAAAGFADGLGVALRIPLLVVAFALGLIAALVVMSLRSRRV